jgi:uncharacterized RDD family membrane protein YckC
MICLTCGTESGDAVRFCTRCGSQLAVTPVNYPPPPSIPWAPPPGMYNYLPQVSAPRYANFFARFFALLIDEVLACAFAGAVYGVVAVFGYLLAAIGIMARSGGGFVSGLLFWIIGIPLALLAYILYFVKLETSANQATFGKRMLGLRITNMTGGTITAGQSLGRLLVKSLISDFFLCIGFFMAAFTERKQALHDLAASTLVIEAR